MAKKKSKVLDSETIPGSVSAEERQNRMISYAIDMAEEQLMNRTASSQVLTHYLKLATVQSQLELEKLTAENELLKAKTDALRSAKEVEELYSNALKAMTDYGGLND